MNAGQSVITTVMRSRILVGSVVLIAGLALSWLLMAFYGPNTFAGTTEKTILVSRGETFASIVDSLESKGVIRSRALFVFVAKMLGGTNRLQAGKYVFLDGTSNADILLTLRSGKGGAKISVTIPEGLHARAQARLLAQAIGIDSARYAGLANDEEFARSLGIDASSLEGYLFPETYNFSWAQDEREVIERLVAQFRIFYGDSLRARADEMRWTTNQVITLASIVEGEALRDDERSIISGVYHNRLRRGMKLEADPTIQYFIGGGPRRVLYSDLKRDNPYNTYVYRGLPPGPVGNPGRASILAALFPTQHNYLYFVSNGRGGHWFAASYEEHQRYVRMYRRLRAHAQLPR